MLHTVYSNAYECLALALIKNIETQEKNNPTPLSAFETVDIITPSRAIQTSVKQRLAERKGICAGLQFLSLSQWFQEVTGEDLRHSISDASTEWRIWRLLKDTTFVDKPECARLKFYLKGKNEEQIFSLAQHISALFTTYYTYRIDWILGWLETPSRDPSNTPEEREMVKNHPDYGWQKAIWIALGRAFFEENHQTFTHPARPLLTKKWTQTIHIFIPLSVPPLMIPLLSILAKDGDIWLYIQNPCKEYWYDLVPQSLFEWDKPASSFEQNPHPLLASLGKSTKANIDRLWRFTSGQWHDDLLSQAQIESVWPEGKTNLSGKRIELTTLDEKKLTLPPLKEESNLLYVSTGEGTLLSALQNSILDLDLSVMPESLDGADESIRFFEASSPLREVEQLTDTLYRAFETLPDLKPDDVLVVTPDLKTYAPLIEAVFSTLPEDKPIPWRISGLSQIDKNRPMQAVIETGHLLLSRFTLKDFLDWLRLPTVMQSWQLTLEDLSILEGWLTSASFIKGIASKEAKDETTLERAIERLSLGFTLSDDAYFHLADTIGLKGSESSFTHKTNDEALLFNKLLTLKTLWIDFFEAFEAPQSAKHWHGESQRMINAILETSLDSASFALIASLSEKLSESMTRALGQDEPLNFRLFWMGLENELQTRPPSASLSNAVTFTGMDQLRTLPFRVVAVLGLNEASQFPGTHKREEYDLTQKAPRRGDRDSREDNRNVFLDLLVATRDQFIVSYVMGDGKKLPLKTPSILVTELKDFLTEKFPIDERGAFIDRLTYIVPMHPFSRRNFTDNDKAHLSYNEKTCAILNAAQTGPREKIVPFVDAGLVDLGLALGEAIPLKTLMDFWKNPAKWSLLNAGIRLKERQSPSEPFYMLESIDGLTQYSLTKDFVRLFEAGHSLSDILAHESLNPYYGLKSVRHSSLEERLRPITALIEKRNDFLAKARPLEEEFADLKIDEHRLTFTFSHLYLADDERINRLVRARLTIKEDETEALYEARVNKTLAYHRAQGLYLLALPIFSTNDLVKAYFIETFLSALGRSSYIVLYDFKNTQMRASLTLLKKDSLVQEEAFEFLRKALAVIAGTNTFLAQAPNIPGNYSYPRDACWNELLGRALAKDDYFKRLDEVTSLGNSAKNQFPLIEDTQR